MQNGLSALMAYKDPNARFNPGIPMEQPATSAPGPRTNGLAAPNPLTAPKPQGQNGLVARTLDAFQRGLDPKGRQARIDQNKADDQESRAREIATLQGIRKMPVEQRVALLPQISQAMGGQIPESAMSDAELDAALALRMGEAGMVEEPMTAYQQAQIGIEREKLNASGKAPDFEIKVGGNGNYWEFDPSTRDWRDSGVKAEQKDGAGASGFTLGKDQIRFDADGNVIARGPNDPPPDPNAPPDPERIRLEREFAKDWKSVDSNFKEIDGQFKRMEALSNMAKKDPKKAAAADLGLLVSFTKMLDPGSVAREGEVKLTQSAASLVDQVAIWLPRLQQGNTLLPPELREAYVEAAREMYGSYNDAYHRIAGDYENAASRYQYDVPSVMMGYRKPAPPAPPPPSAGWRPAFGADGVPQRSAAPAPSPARAPARQPVQITGDDEFDALPSGTDFIDPDGNLRMKP